MKSQKALFNLRENSHYLNCAYKAPLLKSSEAACIKALIREQNPADITSEDFFNQIEEIRKAFSTLINSDPHNIAIIPSTSYGFATVLNNVPPKKDGNAVCIQDEFPSGYFALERWCKENDNNLLIARPNSIQKSGKSWNENILDQINDKTSVVLMSSIHWMNGLKFDLESIGEKCRKHDAIFIIDGSQSVGAMPIDVQKFNIDALICASYKWLFGPYSMSLAYINDKFDDGSPLEESWMNRSNAYDFSSLANYDSNYRAGAARFNVGQTSNLILAPMLLTSLHQINDWKPENIQAYGKELTRPLIQYLNELGVELEDEKYRTNHLFALDLPMDINMETLKNNLKANQVFVSVRGQYIRVSVNVFNDQDDIEKLIEVIQKSVA